jgi:hypothetical protein
MSLGQFNANPTHAHLVAAKCYLAGTLDLALEFNFDGGVVPATVSDFIQNCAVSDADWASDQSDWKNISGYCFCYGQYFKPVLVFGTERAKEYNNKDVQLRARKLCSQVRLWVY